MRSERPREGQMVQAIEDLRRLLQLRWAEKYLDLTVVGGGVKSGDGL